MKSYSEGEIEKTELNDVELLTIYLKPGEIYISDKPTIVSTILGSCVSITMFCGRFGIGGICHCILPSPGAMKPRISVFFKEYAYVDYTIKTMLKKFETLGIKYREIEAKLFGGSTVNYPDNMDNNVITVGRQNINTARRILEDEGIRLADYDLGGTSGRRIIFYTHTGRILLKRTKH